MSQNPIVIIGSGLAGYTVIREFRKLENEAPVIILSADHGGFYSKPMLSNALTKGRTPDTLLNCSAEHMAEQMKAVIQPYSKVSAINPSNKNLILQNGEEINYDQLVLALGANQIRLPLGGDGSEEIFSVNNLDDYRHFLDTLTTKKEIAILGAGLIGCMISRGPLQTFRSAEIDDVGGILELIEPLENEGVLARRDRKLIEIEIDSFLILEYDNMIIGCAALNHFPETHVGELTCLAIHPDYRNKGCGDSLLRRIKTKAKNNGINELIVLTTKASHWFTERGFTETSIEKLPKIRQGRYNHKRRSKIFIRSI